MYIFATGYDSLRRRSKRCGSSLNSRNFHCAKGVYVRPLIEDGFLYDSYCSLSELSPDDRRKKYFKVSEKRIHKQIDHDERRENGVQNTHENETPSQPAHPRQLRPWHDRYKLRTHQSRRFGFCSSKTPSSPVPFYQTSIPSGKIGDSIQGHA